MNVLTGATPNPAIGEIGDQIKNVLSEFMEIRGIQSAFNGFLVEDEKVNHGIQSSIQTRLQKVFQENRAKENTDTGVRQIISVAARLDSTETGDIIVKILEAMVQNGSIPARSTCEALLEHDKLQYKNTKFWNNTFNLVYNVIELIDYKGVREIMKSCMEKIGTFPPNVPETYLPQLQLLLKLLTRIFDRNASLLPAYFIVNEIQKQFPENRNFPHWSVSKLLSCFVDSFKPIAQMVTVIGRSKFMPVIEHSANANGFLVHSWKLDPSNLRLQLKGNLPYDKEILQPQAKLMRYILEQPYSRDMACAILGLQKQHKTRCKALEDLLVQLIIAAMEKTEIEIELGQEEISTSTMCLWQHLSTQLIFFVLFQFASFPHIVAAITNKLTEVKLFRGRDYLMWILLQFISGSIQKNPLSDFLPVLLLYDLLYPEQEPLPVPDVTKTTCTSQMAATCIWIHILKKAQTENNTVLPRPLPATLKKHYEFLQALVQPNSSQSLGMSDFKVALLCNAFSTNQELFSKPMAALVEAIHGPTISGGSPSTMPPLSVQVLDSLTVHTKMSVIHNIVTHILKVSQAKSNQGLTPALVETYARLLVYMEIESLGIKGFVSQLLPQVYKHQAWGIVHTLLEMFCYRLHHIQAHYRAQLLSQLHSLAANPQTNQPQLHLCMETTALRLINGFNSVDVHTHLSRYLVESKHLASAESEELNRALILTIARSIHITGSEGISDARGGTSPWFRDILNAIMQNTPHSWSSHTLQCFPPVLAEYFQQNQVPKENKQQLKSMVEEEYRNWIAMGSNEMELIDHFSSVKTPQLFMCVIWKSIVETDKVNPIALKILERIGPKGLSAHLRKFCDYVVGEFSNAPGVAVSKYGDAIHSLIWKFNIVPFDRFLLCMALRTLEGNEAQICFFIINFVTVKSSELKNRVQEFINETSPEHWKQSNWHEKHKAYRDKFPESYSPNDLPNQFPVYFGNMCLRMLPVFDILIHRCVEVTTPGNALELLLQNFGTLYRYHDRPITYLYNTLHYYESRLRENVLMKKRLVSSILGLKSDPKPNNCSLTDTFVQSYASVDDNAEISWVPDATYYAQIIHRYVEVVEGRRKLTGVDWRYNEFPNPASHVLHATCVELMSLPVQPAVVCVSLIDVVRNGRIHMQTMECSDVDLESWFNACGLILVTLPDPYWLTVHEAVISTIESLDTWRHKYSPLVLFNYKMVSTNFLCNDYAYLLGILHAVWHHLGTGHIHHILTLMVERLPTIVKNEIQLLFVAHMIGPFLQRFNGEKPQMVCKLTVALYELLEIVDKSLSKEVPLLYIDTICDLLYHIKYMFTGDVVKDEVKAKIRNLRPELQNRLRFITPQKTAEESMTTFSHLGVAQNPMTMMQ